MLTDSRAKVKSAFFPPEGRGGQPGLARPSLEAPGRRFGAARPFPESAPSVASGKVGYRFFGELILDSLERTERAMTQRHIFTAAKLCLQAQAAAIRPREQASAALRSGR